MPGELRCAYCSAPFKPRDKRSKYCSLACYKSAPRPKRDAVAHRSVRAPGHPVAPPSGITYAARIVLYNRIGPGSHPCHWCGRAVTWRPGGGLKADALIVDHLDFDPANDDVENLAPSCNICNRHRLRNGGRAPIKDGELFLLNSYGDRTRAIEKTCERCGEPFIARVSQIKIGRGRFCSRSCARSSPRSKRTA